MLGAFYRIYLTQKLITIRDRLFCHHNPPVSKVLTTEELAVAKILVREATYVVEWPPKRRWVKDLVTFGRRFASQGQPLDTFFTVFKGLLRRILLRNHGHIFHSRSPQI